MSPLPNEEELVAIPLSLEGEGRGEGENHGLSPFPKPPSPWEEGCCDTRWGRGAYFCPVLSRRAWHRDAEWR